MLISEKNHMKVHKNQWVLTRPYHPNAFLDLHAEDKPWHLKGQKPSQWPCLTKLPRKMYSQPIVHKALSWGTIRKSACVLAEIPYRKSQWILRGVLQNHFRTPTQLTPDFFGSDRHKRATLQRIVFIIIA